MQALASLIAEIARQRRTATLSETDRINSLVNKCRFDWMDTTQYRNTFRRACKVAPDAVENFITRGADARVCDEELEGILHGAHSRSIQYLVDAKCDIDRLNTNIDTPLIYALEKPFLHDDRENIVISLVRFGANLTFSGRSGRLPLDIAESKYHAISIFLRREGAPRSPTVQELLERDGKYDSHAVCLP